MNTKITKSEQEWQKLEQCFKEIQQANPEEDVIRVLTWVVTEGRFSSRTINRGVNRLVDESNYCRDTYCPGECLRFHGEGLLKNYLLQWASPAVMKMIHLTREDLEEMSTETVRY